MEDADRFCAVRRVSLYALFLLMNSWLDLFCSTVSSGLKILETEADTLAMWLVKWPLRASGEVAHVLHVVLTCRCGWVTQCGRSM